MICGMTFGRFQESIGYLICIFHLFRGVCYAPEEYGLGGAQGQEIDGEHWRFEFQGKLINRGALEGWQDSRVARHYGAGDSGKWVAVAHVHCGLSLHPVC